MTTNEMLIACFGKKLKPKNKGVLVGVLIVVLL
jgi:hypothetical protein